MKLNSVEIEQKNIEAEIFKIVSKYNVKSFDELWGKLESGKVTESECLDDLIRLEYLELKKEV